MLAAAVAFAGAASPSLVRAQTTRADTASMTCAPAATPAVPSADQRRAARDFVARAQEAAIVSDDGTARDLYQRAARLDPSDPSIAYALARSYESAHDARAIGEYCRFLALQPNAPEAPDVRRRVAALAYELGPRRAAVVTPPSPPSPGGALALGIFIPGGGQYYTHRPLFGMLVTAATAGAIFYGLQQRTVTDSVQFTDPNGKPYFSPVTRKERSNLGVGIGAAAGVSLLAALEAYGHARSSSRVISAARALRIESTGSALALGVALPLSR